MEKKPSPICIKLLSNKKRLNEVVLKNGSRRARRTQKRNPE